MQILYDLKLKRPGCVLLQAAYQCSYGVAHAFDSTTWLLSPTPDMKIYEISELELKDLVKITHKANEKIIEERRIIWKK